VDQPHFLWHIGERPEGCDHRPRRCLLKGCERPFWPRHWRSHFCSKACQEAARRWQRWQANQKYRATENGGGNKVNAIASGNETGKLRQLTRRRRARVSAHNRAAKIPPIGRAIGRAATSFLPFPMNIRASVFAAWCADWRCVACWTAKRATRHGVVGRVVSL
jgi:hypothetical protein